MTREQFKVSLMQTFDECLEISNKKNSDYATGQDPFQNFRLAELMGLTAGDGIMLRFLDKVARLSNVWKKGTTEVDESIEDTIMDAINYLAILRAWRSTLPK